MVDRGEMVMVKGKRSKRARPESPGAASSSTTAGPDDAVSFGGGEEEEMANCLILLAKGSSQSRRRFETPPPPGFYQCKTCSKSFPSFQALGGHRASHTKPAKDDRKSADKQNMEEDSTPNQYCQSTILSLQIPSRTNFGIPAGKARVHECSFCGAEFASGQALGGHMRRHRPIPPASGGGKRPRSDLLALDLNLPPAPEERESKFPFAAKEQVIVFSASPLVDCHY